MLQLYNYEHQNCSALMLSVFCKTDTYSKDGDFGKVLKCPPFSL